MRRLAGGLSAHPRWLHLDGLDGERVALDVGVDRDLLACVGDEDLRVGDGVHLVADDEDGLFATFNALLRAGGVIGGCDLVRVLGAHGVRDPAGEVFGESAGGGEGEGESGDGS
jgi:hypothetical protein